MSSRLTPWLSSLPVLALYAATLLLETPVILARWLLTLAGAALVLLVLHHSTVGAASLAPLALIPTAWSILALITPVRRRVVVEAEPRWARTLPARADRLPRRDTPPAPPHPITVA